MKILKFKCTLESDVILNVKSATEGNQQTLDFIPGNNFLGIVAGKLYEKLLPEESLYLFHSGHVRFGDAHPAKDSMRTLKVPASMFYPKLKKASEICFIHHFYERDNDVKKNANDADEHPYQLKQCRNGFYAFKNNEGLPVEVKKSFAIKSAYDREKRRSKDEKMFGYESLEAGNVFYFSVETDDDHLGISITKALVGERHIGRSRTAQFGLVKIEPYEYDEGFTAGRAITGKKWVTIYADSRLIFLDKNGLPTFRPTPADLGIGIEGAKILWGKSQVRNFQYAPWNFKRQVYDTDRCGIEKGSVFVVECPFLPGLESTGWVGSYRNEGFGKVIYNPGFLDANEVENGKAVYRMNEKEEEKEEISQRTLGGTPLLDYLASEKRQADMNEKIYKEVNAFVDNNFKKFQPESFASQWGTIRSYAMNLKTKEELRVELFEKKMNKNGKNIPFAYLTHGTAKDKWDEKGRKKAFGVFFEDLCNNESYTDRDVKFALINLASEMAKKCRRKENKQ